MENLLIFFGGLIALLGIIGSIIPGLPGPVLGFLAVLILHFAKDGIFELSFFIFWGFLVIAAQFVDYIFPILGAKFWGVSKKGIWGSVIGMILGLLFFPPFGIILGTFLGAMTGELLEVQETKKAVKVGAIIFIANLASLFFQLIITSVLAFYFFKNVF